ncbi:Gti1/Pac2 family-domain-containing protein [Xylariomycetidae sp. FL2044]|nr:Gti1/Pac2 family-domain-containing protein [Xylariomycetidae sp. FL2044]
MMGDRPTGTPLSPTFNGYIGSTMDALILFEACLSGRLTHVPRRPHDRERTSLIRSGHVFIYEESSSGIKRWTDGVPWSPSRILGNFLLYRELDKPFQPGEKKRAMKRNKSDGVAKPPNTSRSNSVTGYSQGGTLLSAGSSLSNYGAAPNNPRAADERALVGSLIDSYQFKQNGLVKKTISVNYRGISHHLVSYYNIQDVVEKKLRTPSETPTLAGIVPRSSLISSGNFRAPVDDTDMMMNDSHIRGYIMGTPAGMSSYDYSGMTARSMSVPSLQAYNPQSNWSASSQYASSNYNLPSLTPSVPPSLSTPVSYSHSTPTTVPYTTAHPYVYEAANNVLPYRNSSQIPDFGSDYPSNHATGGFSSTRNDGVSNGASMGLGNPDTNSTSYSSQTWEQY